MLEIFFLLPFLFRSSALGHAGDFLFSNQTRESDGLAKEIAREIAFSRERIILVSNGDLCCDVINEKLRLLLLRDFKIYTRIPIHAR